MKKLILSLIIAMVSTGMMAQKQDAKSQKRINEIREMYSNCMNYINENANGSASDYWPIKVEARVNEAAVGVVTYDCFYVPMAHVGGQDFMRVKRSATVFPTNVEEFIFDNGKLAFYYYVNYSYQDEGCHLDTRIYWNADGSLCHFSQELVQADGKKIPQQLSANERTRNIKPAEASAEYYKSRCLAFVPEEEEEP